MTIAESVKFAKDVIKHWGNPAMRHLPAYTQEHVKFAKTFLELAEPEWLDAPDGDGLYWIDCYGYCTLTTVVGDSTWTHGLKQPVDSFKGAKWAKAHLPQGPNRKD